MLNIDGLKVKAGKFCLEVDKLQLEEGEYFSILGKTGSGKTTLLEAILGVRPIEKGHIRLGGEEISRLKPESRQMGYVPQDYVLFCHLNVFENIAFGLRQKRQFNPAEIRSRVEALAERLAISPLLERSVCGLSGGERQRVALARALATTPKLLLMDEPFSALDPATKHQLWLETKRIQAGFKITTLHITHDLEEAFIISDRIGFLDEGKIVQVGRREDIFYRPKSQSLASFLNITNIFEGRVAGVSPEGLRIKSNGFVITIPGKEGLVFGQKIKFCIRPEEVKVLEDNKPVRDSLADNVIRGKIIEAIPDSTSYTLYFKAGFTNGARPFDFEARLPNHRYHKLGLATQKEVEVALRKEAVIVLES
ncbi:MAG: ABC transporter ATP-binding protein [bacterium]